MKKHSFKKSGTNFYKKRAGGGQRPFINFIKKTDKLVRDDVPFQFAEKSQKPVFWKSDILGGFWVFSPNW